MSNNSLQLISWLLLLLTRHLLPSLVDRRGTIVNVGSAITCVANSALGAYGATKAGLAYWNDAAPEGVAEPGRHGMPGRAGPDHNRIFKGYARPRLQGGQGPFSC